MPEPSFERPSNSLYRNAPEPFEVTVPVVGLMVRFTSNARPIMDVVESAFGSWRTLARDLIDAGPPLHVRILMHEPALRESDESGVVFRLPDGDRTLIHGQGTVGVADPARREAVVYVSPAVAARSAQFRYSVVEAMTWSLITRFDRQPLHAAALYREGRGLLLCGAGGAGKSTLVYAAARAGFKVLSDDVVYLQQVGGLRAWGVPSFINVAPDVVRFFPELDGREPSLRVNGKLRIPIEIANLGALPPAPVVQASALCILGERRSRAELVALTPSETLAGIDMAGESGFDVFADSIQPILRDITRAGSWRLHPGDSPLEGVRLLEDILHTAEVTNG
jgi:hypothetical protein